MSESILFIHPAALYIPHKASIKQHLSWLYFVHNATNEIQNKKSFVVSLADLKEGINYKSEKNNQVLIQSIKKLTKVRVQFDMFNPETDWPYQALLQRCQVPKYTGGCRYSFHPDVHEVLKKETNKKPLRINILKSFRSKHSLAIYCLLISRLAENITYTELNMNLNELTRFLGYDEEDMLLPGDLKRKLVQQVKKELNQHSDLSVHIEVIQEKRRKIKGFKFVAQLKPNHHKVYQHLYKTNSDSISNIKPLLTSQKESTQTRPTLATPADIQPQTKVSSPPIQSRLEFTMDSFPQHEPKPIGDIDLEKIEHPQIKAEALKRFQKRLETHYKNLMQENMQKHLEDNFQTYQSQFIEILDSSVNAFMLRQITNRNMGRKNPKLMQLSQTIADSVMENTDRFDFQAPSFEDWKSQFELDSSHHDTLNRLKQDALKAAQQIYRY